MEHPELAAIKPPYDAEKLLPATFTGAPLFAGSVDMLLRWRASVFK